MSKRISTYKIKKLYEHFLVGVSSQRVLARDLKISRNTIKAYFRDFSGFKSHYSSLYYGVDEYLKYKQQKTDSERYLNLKSYFIQAYKNIVDSNSNRKTEWIIYQSIFQNGYGYTQFAHYFSRWLKENKLSIKTRAWRIKEIPKSDYEILRHWRLSTDKKKWEKAVVVLDSLKGYSVFKIAKKVERSRRKVKWWLKLYEKQGIDGLKKKEKKVNEKAKKVIDAKKNNLIKILHETPKNYEINRTSWSLETLKTAYFQKHGVKISCTMISQYIKSQGYSFRKAKKVLTSPDPLYREKLQNITNILENLKGNEKFFSVDEFGPFAVKMQGGRSFVKNGELKTYPQFQKSKGCLICTAALELSTNQITHFYSEAKNTDEMIKLLEILLEKYKSEKKIYFSWDAASWHASKNLRKRIDLVNSKNYREDNEAPLVELAPLPSSAQFLNVIESVFSGLARSVIHNSNYQSLEECRNAIDLYFEKRNEDFKENPKRAGKKIWGKEKVKPIFNETNNCKDKSWR